jgi:predicted DNA binding protein
VREVLDTIDEIYPGTELVAQRTSEREPRTAREVYEVLLDRLTEKQRAALETAYFAGYFEWPRTATGEEVADVLGVSAPTLANHLRTAERKLLDVLFEGDRTER